MELRHLRYLVAIADAGTFVRASEQLRVAQPALTRQIHDLEKELGVELFDPKARKATLTVAGEACVRLARHVIHDTEAAVARARLANSGVAGRCAVATGPLPLLAGLVPRFVARMRQRYPGITLVVTERIGMDQWDAIERAEIDIGIGAPPDAGRASLLVETQYVHVIDHCVLAPDHPLAARAGVSFADLREWPFLALESLSPELEGLREALIREMKRHRFPESATRAREFSSIESLIAHVRAGQGWTVTPSTMAVRLAGLVAIPISDFRAPFRSARVWRAADDRPVTQTVLRELRRLQEEGAMDAPHAEPAPDAPAIIPNRDDFVPARLDLRHLRSFQKVAKYGSLGRAAEALEVTQPALSRQMRELEYDVGVALLDRGTRGMELTQAGNTFLGDVKGVLSIVDHVPREVRRATRGTAQRCVVGAVPHPYVERIVVRSLADLESRGARVRMGVRQIATPNQADALRAGEIDIAIGHKLPAPPPPDAMRGLVIEPLFDDCIGTALVATTHPLATSESVALRDLEHIPFVWPSRDFFPRVYDAVFERFHLGGLKPRIDAEYDGLTTMWIMVAQGQSWTLGWQSHREEPPPGLHAIPLRDFSMEFGGELVFRQDEYRAPILAAIDAILMYARQMYPTIRASDARLSHADTREAVNS